MLFKNIKKAELIMPEYINLRAQSLIRAVMARDPSKRLGATRTTDIQEHEYFRGLDFGELYRRALPVPNIFERLSSADSARQSQYPEPAATKPIVDPFGQGGRTNTRRGWFGRNAEPVSGRATASS